MTKREDLQANDAVWAAFYRDGKTLGEIAQQFDCGIYDLSPWLTAPLAIAATQPTRSHSNPVAWGVFRDGEMIAWVPGPDEEAEYKLPEDRDERRPLYALPPAPVSREGGHD